LRAKTGFNAIFPLSKKTTHEMVLWEKQKLADILEAVADDFLDKAPLI
jgi:hypothetical protein